MSRPDVDGLNAGYAALVLEQYLDNPEAVPAEWRTLFESDPEALLRIQPGLARFPQQRRLIPDGCDVGRRVFIKTLLLEDNLILQCRAAAEYFQQCVRLLRFAQ